MVRNREYAVKVISDGSVLTDGGIVHGSVIKREWELLKRPDRANRVRLGLNCVTLTYRDRALLINTGMGNRFQAEMKEPNGRSASKLNAALRKTVGISPRDVTDVIFTSMHYHNAGGVFRFDKHGDTILNFPNARHMTTLASWEEAMNPSALQKNFLYGPYPERFREDLQLLKDKGRLTVVSSEENICPGVNIQEVGGFGNGHSITFINSGSEQYAYLADLVPTTAHLNLPCITSFDRNPEGTLAEKTRVLQLCAEKGHMLILARETDNVTGYLTADGRFRPVQLDS